MANASTLTFLFTDIEGSTWLAGQYPAEMPALLAQHHAILRQAIEAQHGTVFQIIGDAFCSAFQTAGDALQAALQAQRLLRDTAWQPTPLKVRMGIHTGPASEGGSDAVSGGYIGYTTLARAQRIMSAAHGGQILVSGTSAELLQMDLPTQALTAQVALRDLGAHQLKGFMRPERLWQVVVPDLPAEFPALHTVQIRANNLPAQLTAFIGRQPELAETLRLLDEQRLLTLTGPGGTGKTRLALHSAAGDLARSAFPDGAWLVELAPISSPGLVLPTIAAALNVHEQSGLPLQSALSNFLRTRTLLLILDNCEHLIETCAQAAEALLQAGPGVKILVTSREPLGIAGEVIFRLPTFTLPDPNSTLDELQKNDAIQLFVARAGAVKPGFALTPQNAPAVVQICRRLDGIPLAIELAAARVALFSPAGIAGRLDDRFRLLTGGSRSALHRQQTLEALIDWSYDLLPPEDQRLFNALSVFAGSFSYEAAEAVAGGDILDTLAQLVNKSLVLAEDEPQEGEARYRMLETIRQYAQGKLLASGEMEAVRDRHLEYYAQASKQVEAQQQANQLGWKLALLSERDNLRAAIEWALERRPDTALEMIENAVYFWSQYGYAAEGLRWLEEGIARSTSLTAETGTNSLDHKAALAQAYWASAIMLNIVGDIPRMISVLEESVKLWREVGNPGKLARSLALLGFRGAFLGFPNPYRASAEEGLALGRKFENVEAIGIALAALGREMIFLSSDYDAAQAYFKEAAEEMRRTGNIYFNRLALISLAYIAQNQGDFQTARSIFADCLAIFQEYDDLYFTNVARSGLADTARLEKIYPEAVQRYLETLSAWQELGNQGAVARCLECLAFVAGEQAQTKQAQQAALLRQSGNLLGMAEALREASTSTMTQEERSEYDQEIAAFRRLPSQEAFEAGWRQGHGMTIEQAKAVAEGLLPE